jgi:DNA-binding response OmpR family regulator
MSAQFRILIVEDNDGDADLVREHIDEVGNDQFVVDRACTLRDGQAIYARWRPHVVLLDLNLPDSKGLDTLDAFCDACAAGKGEPSPPIIVLTSLDDDDVARSAMSRCAHDYLVKQDLTAKGLLRSIQFAIQRHGRVTVDNMLDDPDKTDGNTREAMRIIQRVNRTSIGETTPLRRPSQVALGPGGDQEADEIAALQGMATLGKASEVVLRGLDQRVSTLEGAVRQDEVREARREVMMQQMEKLLIGNGRGPLASRLETVERLVTAREDATRELRLTRGQWALALAVLLFGWLPQVAAWVAAHFAR